MTDRQLPWSESCFVCGENNPFGLGVKFTVGEDGRVRSETVFDRRFEGYGGHVHGGVVTALLDEAAAWAVIHESHRMAATIHLDVTFRRPVPGRTPVRVVGEVTGRKSRFVLARSELLDTSGTVMATAEGKFLPMSEAVHDDVMQQLKMPGRPAAADDL